MRRVADMRPGYRAMQPAVPSCAIGMRSVANDVHHHGAAWKTPEQLRADRTAPQADWVSTFTRGAYSLLDWIQMGVTGLLLIAIVVICAYLLGTTNELHDKIDRLVRDVEPASTVAGDSDHLNPNAGLNAAYGRQPMWTIHSEDTMCCTFTDCAAELTGALPYAKLDATLIAADVATPTAKGYTRSNFYRFVELLRMRIQIDPPAGETACTFASSPSYCASGACTSPWWAAASKFVTAGASTACALGASLVDPTMAAAVANAWEETCVRFCHGYYPGTKYVRSSKSQAMPSCYCLQDCNPPASGGLTRAGFRVFEVAEDAPAAPSSPSSSADANANADGADGAADA